MDLKLRLLDWNRFKETFLADQKGCNSFNHVVTLAFIYSFIYTCIIYSFIYPCINLFIYISLHSYIHLFIRLYVWTHSLFSLYHYFSNSSSLLPIITLLIFTPLNSFNFSFMNLPTHQCIHLFIYSSIHVLFLFHLLFILCVLIKLSIYLLTYLNIYWIIHLFTKLTQAGDPPPPLLPFLATWTTWTRTSAWITHTSPFSPWLL